MDSRQIALVASCAALLVGALPAAPRGAVLEERSFAGASNFDTDFIDNAHRFDLDGAGGMDVVLCDTCAVQPVVDLGTSQVLWSIDRAALGLGPVRLVAFADLDADGLREAVLECRAGVTPPGGAPSPACSTDVVVVEPATNQIELLLGGPGAQYSAAFVGDVDGDGRDELVVRRFDSVTQLVTTVVYGSGAPTSVVVEDLTAAPSGTNVVLTWRLSDDPRRELLGLHVQRGMTPAGPFATLTQAMLDPAASMAFEDASVILGSTYWYRLLLVRGDGSSASSHPVGVVTAPAPAEVDLRIADLPDDAGPVDIRYRLVRADAGMQLGVYDIRGRLVRMLEAGPKRAGEWTRSWDRRDDSGRTVARGVYVLKLETENVTVARKVVLSSR